MNKFIDSINNREARTANRMKARKTTASSAVDLFYKIGASRGKNITPEFSNALATDTDLAIRTALWARDVRGGAGERQLFRDILLYLDSKGQHELLQRVLVKVPELGRWDDMLIDFSPNIRKFAFRMIREALDAGNGLCAKWMPRKGPKAIELRNFLGYTPKQYRKTLVGLTNVVESKMCAKEWDEINFSHVPSLASSRYRNAFKRNSDEYRKYVEALVSDDPKVKATVKANASAVYPYDVIKQLNIGGYYYGNRAQSLGIEQKRHIIGQWEALPNFMNDRKVLPMVDVSGSMFSPVTKSGNVRAIDVSVSLGLYCSEKNTGPFKDTFLTFSSSPELLTLKGDIVDRAAQMNDAEWGMNTNLHAAFEEILATAIRGRVPEKDMPEMVLILSDMQFDHCTRFDDSAMQMIERKFENAGYQIPQVVFWNINSYDNVPVKYDKRGVALVSGFSPSIMKAVLTADVEEFTPEGVMRKTLMVDRYAY